MGVLTSFPQILAHQWRQTSLGIPAIPPSIASALEAISERLPSSHDLEQEARNYLHAAGLLARTAGARSRDTFRTAQRREAGYVKVVRMWLPAFVESWTLFEEQAYLLSNGALHGHWLKLAVASLAVLLSLVAMLMMQRRSSLRSISKERRPSVIFALSQTESSSSGEGEAGSSFTSDASSDEGGLLSSASAGLRRSTSLLGSKTSSPSTRSSRHFAVGSASKRAEKRSSIIRITSSDPTSSLCHMPVEVDLLAPPSSSASRLQAQRSSSPSQATAMALLKRRKQRVGGNSKILSNEEVDVAEGIGSASAADGVQAPGGADQPASKVGLRVNDVAMEAGLSLQPNRLTADGEPPTRSSSPLQRTIARSRPSMSLRRSPSPLQPDAPEPIPERNSSYHKLNGVVQAHKPRVVGGDRPDAPPSILRKKSQVWTDLNEGSNESPKAEGEDMVRRANSRSNRDDNDGATASSSVPISKARPQRSLASSSASPSSASSVQAWRSFTFAASTSKVPHPHLNEHRKSKRLKAIRLTEPDWDPYVTMHERARERMEKRDENNRSKMITASSSMMMIGSTSSGASSGKGSLSTGGRKGAPDTASLSSSVKRRQRPHRIRLSSRDDAAREDVALVDESIGGDWSACSSPEFPNASAETQHDAGNEMRRSRSQPGSLTRANGSDYASMLPRRRSSNGSQSQSSKWGRSTLLSSKVLVGEGDQNYHQVSPGTTDKITGDDDLEAESDFWFERYIPSTAAAGRDWDWRKRRARLRAEEEDARKGNYTTDQGLRPGKDVAEDGEGDEEQEHDLPLLVLGGDGSERPQGDITAGGRVGRPTGEAVGQYTIQGHTFSHGLVGTQLGYTTGSVAGLAPLAAGRGSPRDGRNESPVGAVGLGVGEGSGSGRKKR